jgi:hypothetical protein
VPAQWKSYVLQDREVISGQNPFCDQELLNLLLPALKKNWELGRIASLEERIKLVLGCEPLAYPQSISEHRTREPAAFGFQKRMDGQKLVTPGSQGTMAERVGFEPSFFNKINRLGGANGTSNL